MNSLAKYTSDMRSYLMFGVMSSLRQQLPPEWEKRRTYKVGDQIVSDNKVYVATTAGSTGEIQPKHSSGIITANKVDWLYLSAAATSNDINSNLYIALGGTSAWADDSTPPPVETDDNSLSDVKNDLLTLIRLGPENARIGLTKISWVQNMVFDQYDPNKDVEEVYDPLNPSVTAYRNPFYAVTSTNDVYKCISNPKGAESLYEPSGRQITPTTYADGYIWKYMLTIESVDVAQFATAELLPISVKAFDDGSEQWKVQQAARSGSISSFGAVKQTQPLAEADSKYEVIGTGRDAVPIFERDVANNITRISVYDGGQGYDVNTHIIVYDKTATGSGAVLKATTKSGVITDIEIVAGGQDYAEAPTYFIDDASGSGAVLEIIVNSVDGSISNVNVTEGGQDYVAPELIVVPGQAAATAKAVLAPANGHGANAVSELGARAIIIGVKNVPSMAPYLLSGTEYQYRRISLISDVKTRKGEHPPLLAGSAHPDKSLYAYDPATGFVLWTSNNKPITRTPTQEEYIKIGLYN